jgi:phosphoribosylaminoimidazolecarboxamide formyltransferase/IMP cyclohydrolase
MLKDLVKAKCALISVYDKTGLLEIARLLNDFSIKIISTGGTAEFLQKNGIPVTYVSDITGFPEILGGRVKTLHPKIHGGILAKRDDENQTKELEQHNIPAIDLVIVNLYPFEQTVAKADVDLATALENIDIGGPCMIRAAAKNFPAVAVVTDTKQYPKIIEELQMHRGGTSYSLREKLAAAAFNKTCDYDLAIYKYFAGRQGQAELPDQVILKLNKVQDLRYGENPHQKAAFYADREATAQSELFGRKLHGKELSYNNILDMHAAVGLVYEFDQPCSVILKHNNPCGVAVDDDISRAFDFALATDPVSAYGGIVAFNRQVTSNVAEKMSSMFLEVIVAPGFTDDALAVLTRKKNLRLIEYPRSLVESNAIDLKKVYGGYLLQNMDRAPHGEDKYSIVTTRQPSKPEWEAMKFGWKVIKWVKSNAVIYVSDKKTLGIGAGQMSRVDSSRLAIQKAADAGISLAGSTVISDAFFPFRDGIDAAAQAGATAIIQPGGSVRDNEVIEAANEHDMAMVFTGIRHFRH